MNDIENHGRAFMVAQSMRFKDSMDDWDAVKAAALRALDDADRRHAAHIAALEATVERVRALPDAWDRTHPGDAASDLRAALAEAMGREGRS